MIGKNEMGSKQAFAQVVCIIGGVFDGLMLFPMLLPGLGGKIFGIRGFSPGSDYRYAMNVGASLMLGWTLLLFWASRRPIERAMILLLTAIVVVGLLVAGACAVLSGLIPLSNMLPVFALQSGILALFLTAYLKVGRVPQSDQTLHE